MSKKLKTLSVYRRNLVVESDSADEPSKTEFLHSRTEYEPRWGKTIRETQYNADGQVEQVMEYEYDDKGFLVKEILKEGDGTVMEHKTFEPDDDQRVRKEFCHYADGSYDVTTYHYDEKGRLIKKETHDDEGDLEGTEVMEYENDLLVKHTVTGDDGEKVSEVSYQYDENGLLLETHVQDFQSGTEYTKVTSYDDKGRRKASATYDSNEEPLERLLFREDEKGRLVEVVEENRRKKNTTKMQYDEKDNIIKQQEYDLNGELVNEIERTYDEEGRLLESRVHVNRMMPGISRNYSVRHEYTFYQE